MHIHTLRKLTRARTHAYSRKNSLAKAQVHAIIRTCSISKSDKGVLTFLRKRDTKVASLLLPLLSVVLLGISAAKGIRYVNCDPEVRYVGGDTVSRAYVNLGV